MQILDIKGDSLTPKIITPDEPPYGLPLLALITVSNSLPEMEAQHLGFRFLAPTPSSHLALSNALPHHHHHIICCHTPTFFGMLTWKNTCLMPHSMLIGARLHKWMST